MDSIEWTTGAGGGEETVGCGIQMEDASYWGCCFSAWGQVAFSTTWPFLQDQEVFIMLSDKNDPTWCTLNPWAVHMHTCCTYSTDMCIHYDSLREKQENHTMTQGNTANNSWETLAQKGTPPQTTKDWLWCWVFPKTPRGVCYTVEVSVRIPLWLGNHTPVGHSGSSQWFGMIQMNQEFKRIGSACG